MAKNLELNIVLGAAVAGAINGMSQVANALKNTTKSVKEFEKEIKSMEKAQRAFQNMDKARDGLNKINSEYKKAAEHLQKLKDEYEKTGSSNKQLAKEIEQAEKNVGKLNKQKERQQHVFEAARSKIEAEGASLSNYRSKVQEVEKEIEKMNKLKAAQGRYEARQENIEKLKEFGDRQLTQGIGMAGALAVPVKIAVDVEESQADLRKVVNNAEKYYGKLREISERSTMSQAKVFEMAGALAQSGIEEKDLEAYTEQANKIAVAFDMDAAAAGNFLAKTKEQLGLGKEELFAYSNAINHMSDHSASRAAELTEISGRIGGAAKAAGVSNSALLGLSATLVSFNKTPEQAATGLKNFFGALTKGEASSKKAAAAFRSMGIDVNKLAVDMQRDGEGTILRVLQKLKEVDPAKQGAIVSTIFGEEAKSSVLDMINNLDKVKSNLKEAKKGFGKEAVDAEYANRMNTTLNKFLVAKNKVVNSMADLGKALMPTITGALEKLNPLIDKVSQFIQKNPQLAAGIMKAAAAFAVFKIGIGGLSKGLAPLFSGISKGMLIFDKFKIAGSFTGGLKTAFPIINKLGPAMAKLGPMLTNPYVAAGAAAVAAFVLMYSKWNWFRNGVNNGVKQIAPHFKGVFDSIKNGFSQLFSSGSKELGKMKPMFDSLKPVLTVIGTVIKVVVIAALIAMKTQIQILVVFWKVAFTAIRVVVMVVFNVIKAIVIGAVAVIKGIVMTLGAVFKVVWTAIKVVAIVVWAVICAAIIAVVAVIKAIFRPFAPFFSAIWNAIKAVAIAVWNAIKGAATALWGALKSGISGAQGFFTSAWETMKSVATGVWNAIKGAFDTMAGGLKKAIDGVANYFKKAWEGIKNFAANNPISAGIGGLFGQKWTGTNYFEGGLTTVAERGAELIQIPGKPAFLAESEMLLNLPKGTRILNNSQTRSTLRDKVANLKDRVNNLKGGNSYAGNNYSITINVNGGNPSEVERIVRKVIAGDINKRERTAFG